MMTTSTFRKPEREIYTEADLQCFLESETFTKFTGFIGALGDSVKNKKLSDPLEISEAAQKLLDIIQSLDDYIADCPPEESMSRYGNASYRIWFKKMTDNTEDLLKPLIGNTDAVAECAEYFKEAFGNLQRIDYGTGHEANFVAFLYCVHELGLFSDVDYSTIVLRVFKRYIELMYKLQTTYWLEPAGSHGVWGLDDYQFLPFYFGAAQLIDHKHLKPKSIHSPDFLEQFAPDYLYFQCIANINNVKTESLQWHSPMLNDISGVKLWSKVHGGLMKMYKVEVLGKLPIMQHFLFGSLLSFKSTAPEVSAEEKESIINQEHHHSCCTAHVPSAAAVKAMKQRSLIPFD